MTVYSQHPQRGKIQILATYRSAAGYVTSTVTSVDETMPAAAIVEALNRISACATIPLSVYDQREGKYARYPTEHVATLTDLGNRPIGGSDQHSLWYGCVMHLLSCALGDLDKAAAMLPLPIGKAITAELEAEAQDLPVHRDEHGNRIQRSNATRIWHWKYNQLTAVDQWADLLSEESRSKLDELEKEMSADEVTAAIADLGVLIRALLGTNNKDIMAGGLPEYFNLQHDWEGDETDYFFLDVDAPLEGQPWHVSIGKWRTTASHAKGRSQTGDSVLSCKFTQRPTVAGLVNLFDLSGAHVEQLATWAKTPVGEELVGTNFVVTDRSDEA